MAALRLCTLHGSHDGCMLIICQQLSKDEGLCLHLCQTCQDAGTYESAQYSVRATVTQCQNEQ